MAGKVAKLTCTYTVVVLAWAAAVMAPYAAEAAVTCGTVMQHVFPCAPFMMMSGWGGSPSETCCNEMRALGGDSTDSAERRDTCLCLKSIVNQVSYIDPNLAETVLNACGLTRQFPFLSFSRTADCDK
ncbi:non-specific lipid-transfer protein 3-like [Malania oleifera]|uniref:non-specific lipid-transfer protein 3-like n=1 Tax=Malania oleifera TaxID=397392 RepID=UPI0025ADC3B5|nr:non-specific lipid-transfer protein 3-like [Malania oleifera]